MELRSHLIRSTLLGLVVLGIGGRILMRLVAHMEGLPPVLTLEGSVAVVFYGTVSGAFAGIVSCLVWRFIERPWLRSVVFIAICGLISWRGVRGLVPVSQMLFMGLALFYLAIVDIMARRTGRHSARPTDHSVPIASSV